VRKKKGKKPKHQWSSKPLIISMWFFYAPDTKHSLILKNTRETKMKLTKNFKLEEFACKSGEETPEEIIPILTDLAEQLQELREHTGMPIRINSGYRSPAHNAKIGGVKNSQHTKGTAADIVVVGQSPRETRKQIEILIKQGKMKQGGIGAYSSFTHYDIRGYKARWKG
jgi:uncharacterized protein YcbK (DUF882 family)